MPTLRPYQRDLIERGQEALARERARVLLQLPTGAGKTVVGGALVWRWLMDQPRAQAAWLTHRVELSAQTEARLRNDFSLKVESSSVHWNTGTPAPAVSGGVRLLQAQTVARRIAEPKPVWHAYGPEDLLIVDEAHHAAAVGWETAISQWPGRVVGLTATPWRLSANQGFDHIFDVLICGPQIPELQREGYLAHSCTFTPPLEDRIIGGVVGVAGDFTEVGIERSNAPMVMTTKAIQYWERMARDRSTIVYAVSTGHAHNLVEEFAKTNVPVAVLLSETPADERERAIEGFRIGTIQVLVNVMVATEGFDLPDASCVVITRPTKSLALFLQMVGRALRPKADGGDCLILDLTGISEIHGTPETVREWQLSARGETVHGDPPVIRCWRCGFMAHPTYHSCPRCDSDMGRSCPRCGRFRLWQRWSQQDVCEDVCDHCVPDKLAEMDVTSGDNPYGRSQQHLATTSAPPRGDESALLSLYHPTAGPTWNRRDGWATDLPLAEWYGVSVDQTGRVVGLDLHGNGLVGEIPDVVGSLSQLTALDLSGNLLTGSIPSTLGELENLTWLDLSDNQLSGRIPPSLGRLAALSWLRLHDNRLEGAIPSELGCLENLQVLRLHNNVLSGPEPEELTRFAELDTLGPANHTPYSAEK